MTTCPCCKAPLKPSGACPYNPECPYGGIHWPRGRAEPLPEYAHLFKGGKAQP